MRQAVVVTELLVDDATRRRLETPRDDFVLEAEAEPGRFELVEGPFHAYERQVEIGEERDGSWPVVQTVRYRVAMPFFGAVFHRNIRRQVGEISTDATRWPWWIPPERQNARVSHMLGLLCALAFVIGYATAVTTQTMTFAVDDFGVSDSAQGNALASVRIGVLMSLVLLGIADRRGRRGILIGTVAAGCVTAALGAVAPNIYLLAGSQTLTRGLATTASILLGVVAAEEVGARSRAYAIGMLVMTGGAGGFFAIMLLPVAGLADWTWRLLFLVPLAFLPACRSIARTLPESRRFLAAESSDEDEELRRQPDARRHFRSRLLLLGTAGFIHASFQAPAHQLLNDFLKDERGFSAGTISLFRMATSLPGILGIVIGGRLAEGFGRRRVGAVSILVGGAAMVATYQTDGLGMWGLAVITIIFSAAAVPALGVYGPELFPTQLRGRANAIITTVTVTGSALGLVIAGRLDDRYGGLGRGIALLGIGALVVAAMVAFLYPETARRELEDINPEDAPIAGRLGDF
ncbi:MAG: MFS transporter [Acidimicrobiales bacterium]|nr:MFS transporter [Acidimicrobiales bacterium]